jgi:hypothetical protein
MFKLPTRVERSAHVRFHAPLIALWLMAWCGGCGPAPQVRAPARVSGAGPGDQPEAINAGEGAQAEPAVEPVPSAEPDQALAFRDGEPGALGDRRELEAAGWSVLDVGSEWVPAMFRSTPDLPHLYERTFIELSNGRFDDRPEGRRAAQERYLEPHGIPPSLALLRQRFFALSERRCSQNLALGPLQAFSGVSAEEGAAPNLPEELVKALQTRLTCEGHLRVAASGVFDEDTQKALEEFERRNRIYARASLRGETLEALRREPLELERRALVRVLTERAVLDLGLIEDDSAFGALSTRARAPDDVAPNLVRLVQERITSAFGLQTLAGLERFYGRLEAVLDTPHYALAIESITLPAYHARDMELSVEIDRGDLYYEFPLDEAGKPLSFAIERGPTLTLFAREGAFLRPLVQYPTTIGGWRVRRSNGDAYWQYKESPAGQRVWKRIDAAPVWLPPPSTPSESLVATFRRTSDGSEFRELNVNLVGPSFASAYGLVAAHQQRITPGEASVPELTHDDGMRTHGSADYTSIGRTVSSGCHRLHNHLAMRLLHFVLAHRSHQRLGHLPTRFRLQVSTQGFDEVLEIKRTGYQFLLESPMEVRVLPGRVRGQLKRALRTRVPAASDASTWPTLLVTPTGAGNGVAKQD